MGRRPDREGHCTSMRRTSRRLDEVAPVCAMGGPDHPQLGDQLHAGGADVWAETRYAGGKMSREEPVMDGNRLG